MWRELVGNYYDFMGLSRDIGDFQRALKMKPFMQSIVIKEE
jgi:hypothetical protein